MKVEAKVESEGSFKNWKKKHCKNPKQIHHCKVFRMQIQCIKFSGNEMVFRWTLQRVEIQSKRFVRSSWKAARVLYALRLTDLLWLYAGLIGSNWVFIETFCEGRFFFAFDVTSISRNTLCIFFGVLGIIGRICGQNRFNRPEI